jgi:Anti-sigma factor NepR
MIDKNKELEIVMVTESNNYDPEVTLSPRVEQAIGQSLIDHYNDIVSAPIPDKFLSLLAELEAKENAGGK